MAERFPKNIERQRRLGPRTMAIIVRIITVLPSFADKLFSIPPYIKGQQPEKTGTEENLKKAINGKSKCPR